MPQTVRDTAFDTAKAIAIIGMCIGHAHAPQTLGQFIYLFHMPLFFIVSGYFFSLRSLDNPKDYIMKRVKRLYVPMVLIVWAEMLFRIIYQQVNFGSFDQILLQPIWRVPLFLYGNPWFLKCLFIVSMITLVVFLVARKFGKYQNILTASFFVLTFILGYASIYSGMHLTDTVIRIPMILILFYVGILWKSNKDRVKMSMAISMIIFVIFLIVALRAENGIIDINQVRFPNPVTYLFFSITGTYMVYCFSKLINKNNIAEKVLTYIGQNSLVIYLFNHICNEVFKKITGGGYIGFYVRSSLLLSHL